LKSFRRFGNIDSHPEDENVKVFQIVERILANDADQTRKSILYNNLRVWSD